MKRSAVITIPSFTIILLLINISLAAQNTGGIAGSKLWLKGAKKKGASYRLGSSEGPICIAEGYATAASIFIASGYKTYVAGDCNNLRSVAELVRFHNHTSKIILCADK